MNAVTFTERPMTPAEFARMNAGFDEHTRAHGNPVEVDERHGFVITDAGAFVGCSSGLAQRSGDAYNGWFYLTDLFVEPAYRGRGPGAAVLARPEGGRGPGDPAPSGRGRRATRRPGSTAGRVT